MGRNCRSPDFHFSINESTEDWRRTSFFINTPVLQHSNSATVANCCYGERTYPPAKDSGLVGSQGTAVRALPVDPTAGKTPQVIFHTGVADLEPAGTGPAKWLRLSTATARV